MLAALGDRVFHVIGGSVTLEDLTIEGGTAADDGGAIYNQVGNVTIRSSPLRANTAVDRGGAIFNEFGTVNYAR